MVGEQWYSDFVDRGYEPSDEDLVALFRIEPAEGVSIEEAAGRVASESSIGTWTTLTTMSEEKRRLMARVYEIEGPWVKIGYPVELFEGGNMPQILSSIAGNVFGMKAIRNLRLEDVRWPREMLESFAGPQFGIDGVRKIFGVKERPLTATVPKPKVGMSSEEHARAGYEAWKGGLDLLKDDENLTGQRFNQFERRARKTFEMRDLAERETGERKSYMINVTAEAKEMVRRAELIKELGGEYVMVDILTAGWAGVQTLRDACEDLGLAVHAHRAFHAAFTRKKEHGMSMLVVAKIARLVGVDQLHIGTVIGKLEASRREVLSIQEAITSSKVEGGERILPQEWWDIKPVFPVSSGGLHPGLVPEILDMLGRDIIIQVGGGVWGHPDGGEAGARAVRQAIDAALQGISLDEYAEEHPELKRAMEKWGYTRPT
ncbi:MAG: type III ribulose-bisphosphate carboxylase [Hadesarchaea archaeon]|nr:type III ribulose-bisphosphate carboxylase [Hadesarchaea archaeon]